ncbi:hypothetical protein [Lentzea sp. NPDC055074]
MARRCVTVLVALLITACAAPAPEPPPVPTRSSPPSPEPASLLLAAVIDGRTVQFSNGARLRISLLAPPAACWAAEARAFAEATLLNTPVRFTSVTPGEVNLELPDGTDYALLAVREGVLRAEGASGPFVDAELEAALAKRGLWGAPCNGVGAPSANTGG